MTSAQTSYASNAITCRTPELLESSSGVHFMPKSSIHLLFHLLLDLQAVRKDDPDQMLRHGDYTREGLADEIVIIGKGSVKVYAQI